MKTVYGPVPSWRLGRSLGVDLICIPDKTCSFNCVYCQLGKTGTKTLERKKFVETGRIKKDLEEAIDGRQIDIVTLSGTGEPTLAENIGEVTEVIRSITNLPVAILTNSTLLHHREVRDELKKLDHVVAKIDAPNREILETVNNPAEGINFDIIRSGIKKFREKFDGKLSLQVMFIEENKKYAGDMASLAREISPDEVQINTPLRPCEVKPLNRYEVYKIAEEFTDMNTVSVYESKRPKIEAADKNEVLRRRPK